MRLIKIGIAVAALGCGVALAQYAPNPNLPGGGANVPPASAGGLAGPSGSVAPTPLGQGNLPSTSTTNVGGASTTTLGSPSTTLNSPSTTLNSPSTSLGSPSTTLTPPSSTIIPPSTTLTPPMNVFPAPSSPLSQPNNLGVPTGPSPTPGPGTTGGLPTNP